MITAMVRWMMRVILTPPSSALNGSAQNDSKKWIGSPVKASVKKVTKVSMCWMRMWIE